MSCRLSVWREMGKDSHLAGSCPPAAPRVPWEPQLVPEPPDFLFLKNTGALSLGCAKYFLPQYLRPELLKSPRATDTSGFGREKKNRGLSPNNFLFRGFSFGGFLVEGEMRRSHRSERTPQRQAECFLSPNEYLINISLLPSAGFDRQKCSRCQGGTGRFFLAALILKGTNEEGKKTNKKPKPKSQTVSIRRRRKLTKNFAKTQGCTQNIPIPSPSVSSSPGQRGRGKGHLFKMLFFFFLFFYLKSQQWITFFFFLQPNK